MLISTLLCFVASAMAIELDISSRDSIKSAASTITYNMMTYYQGNLTGQVPGLLPGSLSCDPNNPAIYCWWEAGAMWGQLINYWQYTNDSTYNEVTSEALQFQRGPQNNFNPPNQTRSMGIDDQAFWGFSALDAVEANFPESTADGDPSWLALAQAVFNFQSAFWDTAVCGGGYRWQVYSFNAGYNLKNSVSNGGNFLLSARLAYITGNTSYSNWANMVYDWIEQGPLMQIQDGTLYIWDNTDANHNCTAVQHYIWSYNYGIMLMGAAYMYNYTNGSSTWDYRVNLILNSTFTLFFPEKYGGNILFEVQCEATQVCDQDQKSFKAYVSRWLAVTSVLVPSTWDRIKTKLQGSAQGAAAQCSGPNNACGLQWYSSTYEGTTGVGQD
ncbi:hypothetical protein DV738_g5682, partial [Chaetothyriales sp. CBS 135597]